MPAIARSLRWRDTIRLYYELGSRFPGSGWDDLDLGFEHAARCERIAIVTDIAWVRLTVKAIRFLIPGEIRVFGTLETDEARAWITERRGIARAPPSNSARSPRHPHSTCAPIIPAKGTENERRATAGRQSSFELNANPLKPILCCSQWQWGASGYSTPQWWGLLRRGLTIRLSTVIVVSEGCCHWPIIWPFFMETRSQRHKGGINAENAHSIRTRCGNCRRRNAGLERRNSRFRHQKF